jgi:hypothetical protein
MRLRKLMNFSWRMTFDAAGRDHHILGRNADCGLHHSAIALHLAQCLPMSRFLPPLLPEY